MNMTELYFVYPVGMGILAFVIQHWLCRRKVNLFLRMLPGLAILAGMVGCAIPFVVNPYSDQLLTVVLLLILVLGLLGMLLGCIAAWVHFTVVRNRQKQGK